MIYLRLCWHIIRINVFNELTYRTNFLLQLLQSGIELGTSLMGLSIIFSHTAALNGWHAAQLLVLLSIYILVRGEINVIIQPSMQQLLNAIYQGTLDFTLLKPVEAQFLVSTQYINIWGSVDIVEGSVMLVGSLIYLGSQVELKLVILFILTMLVGGAIIYSFWLLLASCAFWLIRIESILAIFQTMYQVGRWPVSIYPIWLRFIFTFLVPIALATTVPAKALTGQISLLDLLIVIIIMAVLLVTSRLVWLKGLKNYTGASA